jgi:chemotaxis family two-component system sensor kinase Cph1
MFRADGIAVLRGGEFLAHGVRPSESAILDLARWAARQGSDPVLATDRLPTVYPPAEAFRELASGVLSLVLSADEPWTILWFRAETVQVVEWAGNPHKEHAAGAGGALTPRASFEVWRESVHGQSKRWTLAEVEAAGRLRPAVLTVRQNRRIRDLNLRLTETLADKDLLLQQKEFLIGEVNHRVQNSLQLVSSFLALQARESADANFQATVEQARRRLNAVALVHRRLYRGDHIEMVDAARYLNELCDDTVVSMGADWAEGLVLDLAPIKLRTDRAVSLGLILTELMINANKYAYDGAAGPLEIRLTEDRANLRLLVADQGKGKSGARKGFGLRMMEVLVTQLGGELTQEDNRPGLRTTLVAPLDAPT